MSLWKSLLLVIVFLVLSACSVATPTPPPSPTPVPSANQLVEQLKAAKLEVENVQTLDLSDSPGAKEMLKFYTPSLCDGCSSIVMIFDTEASATETKGKIELAGKASAAFKFWLYQKGRVLLRMGGVIDKTQADRYGKALNLN